MRLLFFIPFLTSFLFSCQSSLPIEGIQISEKGKRFVYEDTGKPFIIKGVNYDRDWKHRLIEDYWHTEWATVEEDFQEMKELGITAVRIHLQINKFVPEPKVIDKKELAKLSDLLLLAEQKRIYLNLTGLGCYLKNKVPVWYNEMNEEERWETQCFFWREIAALCKNRKIVFCYDLMNEPVVPGGEKKAESWLGGELAGKSYVQRLTVDPAGRDTKKIAEKWVQKLTGAIREVDSTHLITVGVIPWVQFFPSAKPLFYSPEVSKYLDFVSVHFYPKKGELEKTVSALKAYDIGKPVVIEETFPLHCSLEEFKGFLDQTQNIHSGFFSFYWGRTAVEYANDTEMNSLLMVPYLNFLKAYSPEL